MKTAIVSNAEQTMAREQMTDAVRRVMLDFGGILPANSHRMIEFANGRANVYGGSSRARRIVQLRIGSVCHEAPIDENGKLGELRSSW